MYPAKNKCSKHGVETSIFGEKCHKCQDEAFEEWGNQPAPQWMIDAEIQKMEDFSDAQEDHRIT